MTSEGFTEIFVWGDDQFGQLGIGDKQRGRNYPYPHRYTFGYKIAIIACGENHSAFITTTHQLYTMGLNDHGQLGSRDRGMRYCCSPMKVDGLPSNPIKIACGWGHTAACLSSGELYTWGQGEYGALGTGTLESSPFPIKSELRSGVKAVGVSCGSRHTTIICSDKNLTRHLYTWGAGDAGQLGLGNTAKVLTPTRVNVEDVLDVAAGSFHTVLCDSEGRVWTMGGNKFGQLGTGNKRSANQPVCLAEPIRVRKVSAEHHSACLTDAGCLYIWGTGIFGEWLSPKLMTGISAKDVCIGGCFGTAVDFNGKVWSWGSNNSGELGHGDDNPLKEPLIIQSLKQTPIRAVKCGGAFAIALGQELTSHDLPKMRSLQDSPLTQASRIYQTRDASSENQLEYQDYNPSIHIHSPHSLISSDSPSKVTENLRYSPSPSKLYSPSPQKPNLIAQQNEELRQEIEFLRQQHEDDQNEIEQLRGLIDEGGSSEQLREELEKLLQEHNDLILKFHQGQVMIEKLKSQVDTQQEADTYRQTDIHEHIQELHHMVREQYQTIQQMTQIISDFETSYAKLKEKYVKLKIKDPQQNQSLTLQMLDSPNSSMRSPGLASIRSPLRDNRSPRYVELINLSINSGNPDRRGLRPEHQQRISHSASKLTKAQFVNSPPPPPAFAREDKKEDKDLRKSIKAMKFRIEELEASKIQMENKVQKFCRTLDL